MGANLKFVCTEIIPWDSGPLFFRSVRRRDFFDNGTRGRLEILHDRHAIAAVPRENAAEFAEIAPNPKLLHRFPNLECVARREFERTGPTCAFE